MRSLAWALLLSVCFLTTAGREPVRRVIEVSTADELMAAFREPVEDVTVALAPGTYVLASTQMRVEYGTCSDVIDASLVSVGLTVSGQRVRLVGSREGAVNILSGADYGIYFSDCVDCEVERVNVTATSDSPRHVGGAAILAGNSGVRVANCVIRHDPHLKDSTSPRWVYGVCGRNGADLVIEWNEIANNAWGIVLYDDARAVITHNVIEGFGPREEIMGGAMLMACKAQATVERNHLRGFTDGVQLAGHSSLVFRGNVLEEVRGDGISATDEALGRVLIEKNVMYRCGGAGIAVRAVGNQKATRNIVAETGRVSPKPSAVWAIGADAQAAIRKNTLYDNVVSDASLDRDVSREIFWRARRPWTRTYRNTPVGVDGRHRFHESAFLTRYGRWMD